MNVRVKLYAMLSKYLPEGATENQSTMTIDDGTDVQTVLGNLRLPEGMCHLVLVNGVYISPSERAGRVLSDGDHLAVWPPVAGG